MSERSKEVVMVRVFFNKKPVYKKPSTSASENYEISGNTKNIA